MQMISSVPTRQPVVALTFDDGPHETLTEKFLNLFAHEDVKATFFEVGNTVKERPHLVKMLVEAGHEVGNHTMSHPHLPELERDLIREQLEQCQDAINEAAGILPKVFRAPYLQQHEVVAEILAGMGLPSIGANRLTKDWSDEITVEEIVRLSTEQLKPGDIVILHTWQTKSLEAMPEILRRIKAKEFSCVTVSEMLDSVL